MPGDAQLSLSKPARAMSDKRTKLVDVSDHHLLRYKVCDKFWTGVLQPAWEV